MCGIAGAFVYEPEDARLNCLVAAVEASASRGEDAFGVVRWSPSTGFRRYCRHSRGEHEWLGELGHPEPGEITAYLHTSRAEPTTEWRPSKADADIPPFVGEGVAVAHNGIIANDQSLAERFGVPRCSAIDTAVVPGLVARLGVWEAVAALEGGSALAILDSRQEVLTLCRNFLPLALAWEPGMICFASEARFFPGAERPFRSYQSWEMPPYTTLQISAQGFRGPVVWGGASPYDEGGDWQQFPALSWRADG